MSDLILLHIGQPGEGTGYNPSKSLPVPVAVDPTNHCRYVPGDTYGAETRSEQPRLLGFNATEKPGEGGILMAEDWRAGNLDNAVGRFPVFVEPHGGMSSLTVPVREVQDIRTAVAGDHTMTDIDPDAPTGDPGTLLHALEWWTGWDVRRDDSWDGGRGHSWMAGDEVTAGQVAEPITDAEEIFVAEDAVVLVDEFYECWRRVFAPSSKTAAAMALSDLAGWVHPADTADPFVVGVAAANARRLIDHLEQIALGTFEPAPFDPVA